ncbi:MAG: nitroreductase [Clostridiales bacterium]|nr:nitroreductase [Clostridiales bacterium]
MTNEILRQLHERKSVRVYDPDRPVTVEEKRQLLEAALAAPTAGCMCLYTILDITDQEIKDRLAVLCDHQPFIATAPVVLVFLADWQRWYDSFVAAGVDAPRTPAEGDLFLAASDAVIAAQNVVMAAQSMNLGSCYIGDVLENGEQIAELLNIPSYAMPVAMLCIGAPTQQQKLRKKPVRFPLEALVHENGYHRAGPEALATMHSARADSEKNGFPEAVLAMERRKWSSTFMAEMNRSVAAWMNRWVKGEVQG